VHIHDSWEGVVNKENSPIFEATSAFITGCVAAVKNDHVGKAANGVPAQKFSQWQGV